MSTASSPRAQNRILAIDGPAGAGKSTLAGRMAARFGLLNLETGAMYRAFGLKALRQGVALDDSNALAHLSHSTRVELVPGAQGSRVLLDGADVTGDVRTAAVSDAASRVSVHGPVRAWMVRLQQELGRSVPGGIVMEGRDIGTVVFPEASVKIFLVASAEARTERRLAQTGDPQAQASAVLAALRERDERDRSRAESPLRPADDAITLDSTELSLDAVTERVAAVVRERWGL
jgi:cytidylate kinase